MPELPEVETICRGLRPAIEGAEIEHVRLMRPDLRHPFPDKFADILEGRQIKAVRRRAKYLLIELTGHVFLVVHLGMSGRVKILSRQSAEPLKPHDHVVMEFKTGGRLVYHDPRRFGFMDVYNDERGAPDYIQRLGVEPLGNEFNADYLAEKWHGKKTSLKAALLDQRIIAGLGNIYVLEALYRTGISPFRTAGTLTTKAGKPTSKMDELVAEIKQVLLEAIESGGSTLKDYQTSDGSLGYFQHKFQVYGREGEPCLKKTCAGEILRQAQNGRSTFYCSKCQK